MTWVKVCGLREPDDVDVAARAGADAIGLVLAESSPRRVSLDRAARLTEVAAGRLATYLVMVEASPEEAMEAAGRSGVTGVQPHGSTSAAVAAAARAAGLAVLRPVAVAGPVDLGEIPLDQVPLLDTHDPHRHGGTGARWDPSFLGPVDRPWVLAGGLDPDNVREAVGECHPWGVDASSGLESAPGVKDPERIRRFVEEARTA
jgi:phosphoribosylanthranilate isomerase